MPRPAGGVYAAFFLAPCIHQTITSRVRDVYLHPRLHIPNQALSTIGGRRCTAERQILECLQDPMWPMWHQHRCMRGRRLSPLAERGTFQIAWSAARMRRVLSRPDLVSLWQSSLLLTLHVRFGRQSPTAHCTCRHFGIIRAPRVGTPPPATRIRRLLWFNWGSAWNLGRCR